MVCTHCFEGVKPSLRSPASASEPSAANYRCKGTSVHEMHELYAVFHEERVVLSEAQTINPELVLAHQSGESHGIPNGSGNTVSEPLE